MTTNTRQKLRRRPIAPRASRFTARVLLAGFASFGPVGCNHPSPRPASPSVNQGSATGMTESSGPKTEFHREVSAEQQFNVHGELARVHESQGDHEAALVEYQKAAEVCEHKRMIPGGAKLGPAQHALAQRKMAAVLDRMGRFAQADTHYQKALKLSPNDPKVWNDAGYSYYLQGRWADSERALKTAAKLDPNDSRVQTNLGLTLAAQGKDADALTALTRAGGPAIGNANLGFILAAKGNTEQARRHYQTALALQPKLTAARQAVAQLDAQSARRATTVASAAKPAATGDGRVVPASMIPLPPLPPPFIRKPITVAGQP